MRLQADLLIHTFKCAKNEIINPYLDKKLNLNFKKVA